MSMPTTNHESAQDIVKRLPARVSDAVLRCPLCSATAPSRGLLSRTLSSGERWDLAFICPTCGLYITFDAQQLKVEQLARMQGSHWAAWLRQPDLEPSESVESSPVPQTNPIAHYLTTFTACFVLWLMLSGSFAPVDLLWGIVVCTGITALTYRFTAFGAPRWMQRPRGWVALLRLLGEFVRQIVVQNVTLSWRVFSPTMHIKPGIVAVPFTIRGDVPLTILSSLMTLTPDTVVVDVDQQKNIMYIHWIDVETTDPEQMYKLLVQDLEYKVIDWLKDK